MIFPVIVHIHNFSQTIPNLCNSMAEIVLPYILIHPLDEYLLRLSSVSSVSETLTFLSSFGIAPHRIFHLIYGPKIYSVFYRGDQGSNPGKAVKFDIANLYVKVPSGSNRLFQCPLDVLNVQPVSCALVT